MMVSKPPVDGAGSGTSQPLPGGPPSPESLSAVDQIRSILGEHARLSIPPADLSETSDLYAAGLTSLTTVHLMLALEEHFEIEFPDAMLGRKTFESIRSIAEAVSALRP
jgi:acyl carrier protein